MSFDFNNITNSNISLSDNLSLMQVLMVITFPYAETKDECNKYISAINNHNVISKFIGSDNNTLKTNDYWSDVSFTIYIRSFKDISDILYELYYDEALCKLIAVHNICFTKLCDDDLYVDEIDMHMFIHSVSKSLLWVIIFKNFKIKNLHTCMQMTPFNISFTNNTIDHIWFHNNNRSYAMREPYTSYNIVNNLHYRK